MYNALQSGLDRETSKFRLSSRKNRKSSRSQLAPRRCCNSAGPFCRPFSNAITRRQPPGKAWQSPPRSSRPTMGAPVSTIPAFRGSFGREDAPARFFGLVPSPFVGDCSLSRSAVLSRAPSCHAVVLCRFMCGLPSGSSFGAGENFCSLPVRPAGARSFANRCAPASSAGRRRFLAYADPD